MTAQATRRLINATAVLDNADRALLNLWVNRGLDDDRLSALTGMDADALSARRERIVDRLSEELGLPHQDVEAALAEIRAAPEPSANGAVEPSQAAEPPDEETRPPPRRRVRVWIALIVALAIVAIVVLILALSSGGSAHHPAARPAAAGRPSALAGLPGGVVGASGTVALLGTGRRLGLRLRVRGLPTPTHGHYEVWLFNSVIDSEPLGQLPAGAAALSFRLPSDAARYEWIDVSFQPTGAAIHSGQSDLRAANPAHPPSGS